MKYSQRLLRKIENSHRGPEQERDGVSCWPSGKDWFENKTQKGLLKDKQENVQLICFNFISG